MRRRFIFCQIFLCNALTLILLFGPATAQDLDDISVTGVVTDERGALVPGASITLIAETTNAPRRVTSDDAGRYRVVELAPGAYRLLATADGFATIEITNLSASSGQVIKVDVTLRPGGVSFARDVADESPAPILDLANTLVGGTLTRSEIESLPSATRAPLDLLFTFPGVTEEPFSVRDLAEDKRLPSRETPEEAGLFALSGGQAYSNNITIDGLDNNDDRAARERFQPSAEAVEEVQVITNQFSAEYGRASGGRVNLRTRGGGRDYHARLFYFFGDEALNANNWASNARGLKRLPLQRHEGGLTASGPLPRFPLPRGKSERTFLFAAYEEKRTLDSAVIDTLVPVRKNPFYPLPPPTAPEKRRPEVDGAEELAPYVDQVSTPLRETTLTGRVDHAFGESHHGTFLYARGRLQNFRGFHGGSRLAENAMARARHSDALGYTDTLVLSPRAVNQFRFQFSRLAPRTKSPTTSPRPVVLLTLRDSLLPGEDVDRSGTLAAGPSTLGAADRRETRLQWQDTVTLVRESRTFKFGGEIQRIRSTYADLADATGTFNFGSAEDFFRNEPERFRRSFGKASTQRNTSAAFFLQHEWQALSSLNLTLGLRYENESLMRDRNNWGPRFGVALDPFKTGKTIVRFGAGVFYNRPLLRTIDDFTLGADRLVFDTNLLRDPLTGRALTPAERRQFIAANITFPLTPERDAPLVRRYAIPELDFARRLDPALRLPESYQFNFGFERQLGGGVAVEINYTRHRGAHLWREFNANAPVLPPGYDDWTDYLLSRDFANFRHPLSRRRPLYGATSAGELVRFMLSAPDAAKPEAALGRVVERGVPVTLVNLESVNSTTAVDIATAALAPLRPDSSRGAIEQLASIGNSFYDGLSVAASRRLGKGDERGFDFTLRVAYTFSRLIDDGAVNTSDALRVGDFRGERARSTLDHRHRFVLSGMFDAPRRVGRWRFAPLVRFASGAPFNISLGGVDRNLDDVGNDRPIYGGDLSRLRARRPGAPPFDSELFKQFASPVIGRHGTLPRNAGRGLNSFFFDLNITREFRFGARDGKRGVVLKPNVEIDNLLNHPSFSFGAEYLNFAALDGHADPAERQAAMNDFLVPTRATRPRTLRVGLRLNF